MKTDSKPATPTNGENNAAPAGPKRPLLWAVVILVAMLCILFHNSFSPGLVIFSNDGPLGAMMQELNRMPSALKGLWLDLVWLGSESIAPPPSFSSMLRLVASPMVYEKTLCPLALFMAGLGAFYCFRRWKLAPLACILGALAAAFNSDFFSTSCWGVSTQVIGFGAMFAALGFLADPQAKRSWIRLVLAGMAVGVGVMEAYDIGAMFSLFVAAFVVYQTLFLIPKVEPAPVKIGKSAVRGFIVAVSAALIATHTLSGLVNTQIQGIAGAGQDEQTKAAQWAFNTAWSVPTPELLQVVIPGVFGYRMEWHMYESDQPQEDKYWGSAPTPVGTGYYAGVLVVLVAVWALLQSLRTRGSPFTIMQRRAIWFWVVAMIIAAVLAIGKNAPFYQFLYALPYFSTIRNPQKFMHVFSWALIIVFTYGIHGLATAYMRKPVELADGAVAQFKKWRAAAAPFEKWWFTGCIWMVIACALGWMIYAASGARLQDVVSDHLKAHYVDPTNAGAIASFSIRSVAWFVVLLILAVVVLGLICSGQFSGPRARWGGVLLGAFLLFDLGRADAPWIVYWDTSYKYAPDPIINYLSDHPWEHRVSILPHSISMQVVKPLENTQPEQYGAWVQQLSLLQNGYNSAWKQNLFPYHNIQCIDDIQEPRAGVDKRRLQEALPMTSFVNLIRWWELSNTRYILGPGPAVIHAIDPDGKIFRVAKAFDLQPKRPNPTMWAEDWVSVENTNGRLAVAELINALPRAKLYTQWQVNTNDDTVLGALASPQFDPHQIVLVSDPIAAPNPADAGKDPGTVEVSTNYASKRVEMTADVKVPSVLVLLDRYNPKWHAWVDGKPVDMLRCNFITRGVLLQPGKHTIVMRYITPLRTLWISLAVIAAGLMLWGFVAVTGRGEETVEEAACALPAKEEPKPLTPKTQET